MSGLLRALTEETKRTREFNGPHLAGLIRQSGKYSGKRVNELLLQVFHLWKETWHV